MKNTTRSLSGLTLFGLLLFTAHSTFAQTSTTTTTTSSGTISQFSPNNIVVKTTTSDAPVNYSSTKTTTYVDENGNPVSVETVKSGLPVTVYYDRDGNKMVATKVVVRKSVDGTPTTQTVTTSSGTVSQFGPNTIVVKTAASADPVSYTSTNTTTYVDENGNPVSVETVKSGLPVTVYYDRDGNKMIATKVIVKKTTTSTTNP